jgi:hypothetical protein
MSALPEAVTRRYQSIQLLIFHQCDSEAWAIPLLAQGKLDVSSLFLKPRVDFTDLNVAEIEFNARDKAFKCFKKRRKAVVVRIITILSLCKMRPLATDCRSSDESMFKFFSMQISMAPMTTSRTSVNLIVLEIIWPENEIDS